MKTDQVDTDFGKALGQLFGVVLFRETATAVKVCTPEPNGGPIFENKFPPPGRKKSVLTGGLFIFENEGNIHGNVIMVKWEWNVF